MARQNTFLCECGRVIGRMPSTMYYLPWNAEDGDPRHKGVICGGCTQHWVYVQTKEPYVDVKKCCKGRVHCQC